MTMTKDQKYLGAVVLFLLALLLFLLCSTPRIFAQTVEWPMETNITGFWFLQDDTYAAGISHTVLRVKVQDLLTDKFSIDLDGTLAKEFNDDRDTLYGIGIKLNMNAPKETEEGVKFIPSLGITAMNNFDGIHYIEDAFDLSFALYGTVVMYKW